MMSSEKGRRSGKLKWKMRGLLDFFGGSFLALVFRFS